MIPTVGFCDVLGEQVNFPILHQIITRVVFLIAQIQWCKHSGVRVTGSFMWRWMLWFMCCVCRPVTLLSSGLFPVCFSFIPWACSLQSARDFLTQKAHCTTAIHHPRIWAESSSEHLVIFSDSPDDLLALFYTWGNLKMCFNVLGNHIRNCQTSRDRLSASSKRLLHLFYFPMSTFKYGWMLLTWII